MMRKNLLGIPTILLLITSMALVFVPPVCAGDSATVYVDPSEYAAPSIGHNFTVEVSVDNVSRLAGWQFKLNYNTTILDATWCTLTSISSQYDTHLLPAPWNATKGIRDDLGFVTFAATYPNDPDNPFSGNGSLLKINFTATEVGNTSLTLTVQALDSISPYPDYDITSIEYTIQSGSVTAIPPPLPVICLNPSEYTVPAPGESLNIDVNITNAINLQHYEFKLWFNTTLLNATSVTPSSVNPAGTLFIPAKMVGDPPVYEWTPLQNVSDGFVWAGASLPVGQAFTGSGILMTISFTSLTAGNCTLHLNETVLVNSMEVEIDHLTLDGFVTVMPKIGEFHTHHINDTTDDFPNDYIPMAIPINGGSVIIAPVIMCTAHEEGVFVAYHYPCKLAQTIVVDGDWSDEDANYTYLFEDWTDYDWNDIVVNLHAITNYMIEAEGYLKSREAAWKNPFGVQITLVNMVVEVQVCWNSTDYPEEHTFKLNPGETADIELFAESTPRKTALITIIPLVPPAASFVYSPLLPRAFENVVFNASASTPNGGYIVSYEWDFGDSSPHEFGIVVTHHYAVSGIYNVTLNVTNNVGVWAVETKMITVMPDKYMLTITSTVGGTTDPVPGSYSYDEGTIVSVAAIPESGYILDHWELDCFNMGSDTLASVTMNKDHTLYAIFREALAPPVGGHAAPIDKFHVLDLKIGLTPEVGLVSISILLAVMAVTIILIRRRNKTLQREH